ncbi:Pr6Pr family membrane protein [Nonomuraea sp. NPDC049152]|uniref:Pr6Pr family membrane protein n=1 Tax=Nonomuraea sp. NPDC049152 TaxID=3154350 RepID=UPI003401F777
MRAMWRILLVAAAVGGLVCATIALQNPWVTFTVQSNIVLTLYYLWRLLGRETSATVKGAVTLYLVITGTVAFLALPLPDLGGGARHWGNLLLHCVTPVMAIVDWVAFDRSLRPGWSDPLKWLAFPLAYAVLVLVAAPALPRRMARRYLHDDVLVWTDYALAALAFVALFVAAGYALIGLHRLATRPLAN